MAQHLRYPEGDGSLPELPPASDMLETRGRRAERLAMLKACLETRGMAMSFDHRAGEWTVMAKATGASYVDYGRRIEAYLGAGRPRADAIARVLSRKLAAFKRG